MNPSIKPYSQKCGEGLVEAGSITANKTEALEKVTKFTQKNLDIIRVIFAATSEVFANLTHYLKGATDVLEVAQLPGRFQELLSRNAQGSSFFQINTWQKIADRVFLTAHSTLKTVGFAASTKVISLGKVGLYSVGYLPVFKLVTEVLVAISSVFGIWDNSNKLSREYKALALSTRKIEKWENRDDFLVKVKQGDSVTIEQLDQKYEEKSYKITQDIQKLDQKLGKYRAYSYTIENETSPRFLSATLTKKLDGRTSEEMVAKYTEKARAVSEKVAQLQTTQKKYDSRLINIASKEYQALADKLAQKDVEYKLLKWDHQKENTKIAITKAWMGVAKGIFKIAVVALALILTAVNVWATPYLLTFLAIGSIHDGLGVLKIFHDEYVKVIPWKAKAPQATVATAA